MYTNTKGFTLIEMLVVMAIIGILASFTVVVLSSSRIKARDAQRVAYVNQISSALELYYQKNGIYPTAITAGQVLVSNGNRYLDPVPSNPSPRTDGYCPNQDFTYTVASGNTSYTLSFCLAGAAGRFTSGVTICDSGGSCKACGQYTLSYEGVTYNTVNIGGQCWMKENLRVKKTPSGTCINTGCPDASSADNGLGRACYSNSEANCTSDGALYTWAAAMDGSTTEGARGICPAGWHIPTDTEQNTLDQYLTDPGQTCDANRTGWGCTGAGTKLLSGGSSGFEARLAGLRYWWSGSIFDYLNSRGYIWSSTASGSNAWHRFLVYGQNRTYRQTESKLSNFSVRCIKS